MDMSILNEVGASVVNAVSHVPTQRADGRTKVQSDVQPPSSAATPPASGTAVKDAVAAINARVQSISQNLQFSVDHDSGQVIVKVIDGETNTVIRQIPSEEVLAISKALEKLQGLIIKQKA
jgi:flagellar protein FlaG